eukprot:scaffold1692_cov304-Prasinococcus_capsulatus_cf.AAC.2
MFACMLARVGTGRASRAYQRRVLALLGAPRLAVACQRAVGALPPVRELDQVDLGARAGRHARRVLQGAALDVHNVCTRAAPAVSAPDDVRTRAGLGTRPCAARQLGTRLTWCHSAVGQHPLGDHARARSVARGRRGVVHVARHRHARHRHARRGGALGTPALQRRQDGSARSAHARLSGEAAPPACARSAHATTTCT